MKRSFISDWNMSGRIQNAFQIHFDMLDANRQIEHTDCGLDDEKLVHQRIIKYFQKDTKVFPSSPLAYKVYTNLVVFFRNLESKFMK